MGKKLKLSLNRRGVVILWLQFQLYLVATLKPDLPELKKRIEEAILLCLEVAKTDLQ